MIIALLTAVAATVQLPTDRSYIKIESSQPYEDAARCISDKFDGLYAKLKEQNNGDWMRLEWYFQNLGGTAKRPTAVVDLYRGEKTVAIMTGYGVAKGNPRIAWGRIKGCFPDVHDVQKTEV